MGAAGGAGAGGGGGASGLSAEQLLDQAQPVLLRGDTRRLDPYFLAGCLQAAGHRADATATARTSARPAAATASLVGGDLHRVRIPVLELADQRELGADQRQLAALEAAIRTIDNVGSELLRLRYLSFTDHRLPPADGPPETL
ncbi:hypothetical protein [Candidatus Frankia nodulisporulans]|uniref:hypothetical protein n=1 Tax=Candidatus Frankia nodulisporulans TaxID=2060052 RepID=UPI0013D3C9B1|nr:hypothetical protein [Candidatus Frankia nodulisporulans]